MERFENVLGKIVKVGKKDLDDALEAERKRRKSGGEPTESPSDAEGG
jgi:hypothetical protein